MKSLHTILRQARVVPMLTQLLRPGQECFLVGGALRDWLLGKEPADFDFATPFDPTELAVRFAGEIGGKWFFLDEERRQSRIVTDTQKGALSYDFAPFRAPDLKGDLLRRDFTINTLVFPLAGGEDEEFLDPLRGREDLKERFIRACSAECLRADPLRILKGVRHAVALGFGIEPQTAWWMKELAALLPKTAPERRRNELAMILESRPVAPAFYLLRSLDLIPALFGASAAGGSGEEAIALSREVEDWARRLEDFDSTDLAGPLFRAELEDGFSRLGLLKLAAFLRVYAPEDLKGVLVDDLRLSRDNTSKVAALASLDPGKAVELEKLAGGRRGRALWVQSLGSHPVEGLLFLGIVAPALGGDPAKVLGALGDYLDLQKAGRIPDLVTGARLRDRLGLPQGPLIGEILDLLRREEIAGRVQTLEDAEKFVKSAAEKMVDKPRGGSL